MAARKGVASLKKYFGYKPGQSLSDFAAEVKQLDDDSFAQLVAGVENGTLDY